MRRGEEKEKKSLSAQSEDYGRRSLGRKELLLSIVWLLVGEHTKVTVVA